MHMSISNTAAAVGWQYHIVICIVTDGLCNYARDISCYNNKLEKQSSCSRHGDNLYFLYHITVTTSYSSDCQPSYLTLWPVKHVFQVHNLLVIQTDGTKGLKEWATNKMANSKYSALSKIC